MSEKALDPEVIEQLAMLADEDDPDFLVDLLQGYLETTQNSIEELETALKSSDGVLVAKTAHTQKGASGNVGATNMVTFFSQLEEIGHSDQVGDAEEVIVKIVEEFEHVKHEIEALV